MLSEPIEAKDVRIENFSAMMPWELANTVNKWLENADDKLLLDINIHYRMEPDGATGPIWAILVYKQKQKGMKDPPQPTNR